MVISLGTCAKRTMELVPWTVCLRCSVFKFHANVLIPRAHNISLLPPESRGDALSAGFTDSEVEDFESDITGSSE